MAAEMAAALGEFPRVPEILQQVEELEPQCEDSGLRINRLLTYVSTVLLPRREYEEARQVIDEARKTAREIGNRLGEARATGFLGNVDSMLGERERAMEHYEGALAIFRELEHERGVSTSVGNLGLIYRYFGRLDDAERAYREALEIDREVGNREGVARHIGNLGVLYRDMDRLDDAVELLEEANGMFRDLGDRSGTLRNGINLGDVFSRLGQKQRAVIQFQQSERLARECGLPHYVADCLHYRAEVLLAQDDHVRGEPAAGEAAVLYEQLGDTKSAAETWELLARVTFARDDFEPALRHAESCLANLEASGEAMPAVEYSACAILAESALAMDQHDKSETYAARAVQLAGEHEDDPIRVATLKALARKGQASSAT
jgi:tetratricopeptide (TPR) repeat protein